MLNKHLYLISTGERGEVVGLMKRQGGYLLLIIFCSQFSFL